MKPQASSRRVVDLDFGEPAHVQGSGQVGIGVDGGVCQPGGLSVPLARLSHPPAKEQPR